MIIISQDNKITEGEEHSNVPMTASVEEFGNVYDFQPSLVIIFISFILYKRSVCVDDEDNEPGGIIANSELPTLASKKEEHCRAQRTKKFQAQ